MARKGPRINETTHTYPDWQRAKLYRAEKVWARTVKMYNGESWDQLNIHECRDYVEKIAKSKWWAKHSGYPRVKVKDGRGTRHAFAIDASAINLPRNMRTKWIIIHEMAHLITNYPHPWHGRKYCKLYIAMVERFLGKEYASLMREVFRRHGIKWVLSKAKPWQ